MAWTYHVEVTWAPSEEVSTLEHAYSLPSGLTRTGLMFSRLQPTTTLISLSFLVSERAPRGGSLTLEDGDEAEVLVGRSVDLVGPAVGEVYTITLAISTHPPEEHECNEHPDIAKA